MSGRERLDAYLAWLRRRLRRQTYAQAFAAAAFGVLLITVLGVLVLPRFAFADSLVLGARLAIVVCLALVAALLLYLPLRRLRRADGADVLERCMPAQQGRIRTYLEGRRAEPRSALLDLLAEDAAGVLERDPPGESIASRRLFAPAALGLAALGALVYLLVAGPALWGFASRHLLLGTPLPRVAIPVRELFASPGDVTIRRNADLDITARVQGFRPQQAHLMVRFDGEAQWERAPMQSDAQTEQFAFKLYAIRRPLSYFIEAQGVRSPEHRVSVVDLPRIERVRLTYAYPEWTGLEPSVDEDVRDIYAVAGTRVQVEVFADAPLEDAALIVNGAPSELQRQASASVGELEVAAPGAYRIGARIANEFVPLTDDYAIEIAPDEKPTIEIRRPGRDWRASSIEEVPVQIAAQDDYQLRKVELRYSVNGGEWRSIPLDRAVKSSERESLLRLEEIGAEHAEDGRLVPGDLVSYYASAADRRHTATTDLFIVQVQPFERRYTQGQAGGGQSGMGDEQDAISARQREILLATWNLQRNDERRARTAAQLRDNARLLSELQEKLADQARTLAARTRARASLDDERVKTFVEGLEQAAQSMGPAVAHLSEFELAAAIPAEQQALQQLLRAEEAFREVQVAMSQDASSGGAQASRDFTEMFELEMDLDKNQYETESQLSMNDAQEALDEALRKLKELAERQERLAQQAQRASTPPEEQRWRQEQLRREAEDLRRRLAEMQRRQQRGGMTAENRDAESSEGAAGQSSPGAQSQSQAQGRSEQNQSREQLAQALESVNKALDEMRTANQLADRDPQEAGEAAADAGENLRRALREMDRPAPAGLDQALDQLAGRAQALNESQARIESELYEALSQAGGSPDQFGSRFTLDRAQTQSLVQSKQQLAADLSELQRDLRGAVHEHRTRSPETSRRVSEIVRDLESTDVMYRLNRSAAEIYYGRAREAALREGMISEALEQLEQDLQEAAAQAAQESTPGAREEEPSRTLLAQVARLRQTLQDQQANASPGEESAPAARAGRAAAPGEADSLRSSPRELIAGERSLARETAQITERVRDAAYRIDRRDLTPAELDALRRQATELRRLGAAPGIDERQAMLSLIDQIELAALNAAAKDRDAAAARASATAPESTEHRESVAEYYRRLGAR